MKSRLVRISWTVGILFVCFSLISVSLAQGLEAEPPAGEMPIVEETAAASDWPAPELTVGIETRSSETEGIGDVLIPLWYPDGKGLLFINPRLSFNDHDYEEYNIGLGYRQFIDRFNLILGANAYYDYRNTDRDNYGQWGVGLELLSTWIDARANYYHPDSKKVLFDSQTASASSTSTRVGPSWNDPYATGHTIVQDYTIDRTVSTLTTTRTYEQFQQALGGYDWEIGVRLPLPIEPEKLEARVFGGYYDFDNDIGTTAHGWKTRAELRLYTTVSLYAGLNRNSDLTGSDWFAGALFTVPLNPDAAQSRWNADPRVLTDRLTDMVVRDRQVRLGTSEFIENPSLEEKTITRSKKTLESGSLTVMDDVQFVNGDVGTSGDGTGERPFASIQEGADGVFGLRNVYVFHASGPYNENVVLQQDTALWGSGSLIPAFGGRSFGSGVAPIVDGMSMGPTITMADRSTVSGFHIRNSNKNLPPIFYNAPWPPPNPGSIDISRVGIFGDDVTGLAVYDNVIARNSYGALFVRLGDFDLDFARNDVRNNAEHGLWIEGHGNSGSFNVLQTSVNGDLSRK